MGFIDYNSPNKKARSPVGEQAFSLWYHGSRDLENQHEAQDEYKDDANNLYRSFCDLLYNKFHPQYFEPDILVFLII
jgi:hypothetical protein